MTTAAPDRTARLDSVQALRAIAALMVVLLHAIKSVAESDVAWIGRLSPTPLDILWFREALGAGVDVFFVISGFIMVHGASRYTSGRARALDFLLRRLLRIYPPYWVVTLVLIGILALVSEGTSPELAPTRILTSLLLYPSLSPDGFLRPILGVGWTLSYEVYFYLVFFLSLWAGKSRYAYLLVLILLAMLLSASGASGESAPVRFLQDPIVLEFLYGAALGWLLPRLRLSAAWAGILLLFGLLAIFVASWLVFSGHLAESWRCLYWGLPAAGMVLAMLNFPMGKGSVSRTLVATGDASYALYLVHVPVLYFLTPVVALPLASGGYLTSATALMGIGIALSLLVGFGFHRLPWPTPR